MTHDKPFLAIPLPPALSKPFQLTYEPPNPNSKQYAALYELAQDRPKEALKHLEQPNTPESANLKAFVLLQMKKLPEAERLIEENFIHYPDNFSAKINYADLCLRRKKWKEIPKIFHSTDLGKLYPDKNILQASEFRGFMVLMSHYHSALRKYKLAEQFYILAVKADPLHPSVALLENKIFQFRLLKKLAGIFSS